MDGHFEWLLGYADIRPFLLPSSMPAHHSADASAADDLRALVLGCGTSTLGVELLRDGWKTVVNIDNNAAQIEHMRAQFPHPATGPGDAASLEWLVADACDCEHAACTQLTSESFDLAVDKGTLDCILAERGAEGSASLFREVWRLLRCGGVYVLVTLHASELLSSLITAVGMPFEFSLHPIEHSVGLSLREVCVATLRKVGGAPFDLAEVRAHHERVLDRWYREQNPLLTPDRLAKLRSDFDVASQRVGHTSLTLRACYEVMFSEAERAELDFEFFLEDVRASQLAVPGEMTFEEAVEFLKANQ
jgi:SAM-dependent methyltransferase